MLDLSKLYLIHYNVKCLSWQPIMLRLSFLKLKVLQSYKVPGLIMKHERN